MSLVDVDSWMTEYEACQRLTEEIQAQLRDRDNLSDKSPEYVRLTEAIRRRMKQFLNQLAELEGKLPNVQLTRGEAERRRRQIETLQASSIHLQTRAKAPTEEQIRSQLLNNDAGHPSQWFSEDSSEDDAFRGQVRAGAAGGSLNAPLNVNEYRDRVARMTDNQDEGLDTLAQIIARQKNIALRISNEVDDHNGIIDSLADGVEQVDTRIHSETNHVRDVSRLESSTCGYWVVIIALFVAIVIVASL